MSTGNDKGRTNLNNIYTNSTEIVIGNTLKVYQNNSGTDGKIYLQTQASGTPDYKQIYIDSNGDLYYDTYEILHTNNIETSISDKDVSMNYVDVKHLDIADISASTTYLNFQNSAYGAYSDTSFSDGLGIRLSSDGNIQFKHNSGAWTTIDLPGARELNDLTDVTLTSVSNNQILVYNSATQNFENTSNIVLPGILYLSASNNIVSTTSNIQFDNDGYGLVDNIGNGILLTQSNTTSSNNYNCIQIQNQASGGDPIIETVGYDTNIDLLIRTKNEGLLQLESPSSNIVMTSTNVDISGYIKNSIYRISSNSSYSPTTNWNIPFSSDTILFDFVQSNSSGTYYSNITAGVDGQKLNIIFNNSGNQIIGAIVDFGTNNLLCGTGTATKLTYNTSGQSSMLVYLGDAIGKWQILNTGCSID
jgi:hypothetical protein